MTSLEKDIRDIKQEIEVFTLLQARILERLDVLEGIRSETKPTLGICDGS